MLATRLNHPVCHDEHDDHDDHADDHDDYDDNDDQTRGFTFRVVSNGWLLVGHQTQPSSQS